MEEAILLITFVAEVASEKEAERQMRLKKNKRQRTGRRMID
jgi:hypothetical protein